MSTRDVRSDGSTGSEDEGDRGPASSRAAGLRQLARRLGARLLTAEPAGSGDAGSTYRMNFADGRSIAARYLGGDSASARVDAMRRDMVWLAAQGLPVPIARSVDMDDGSWLVTPWVDGVPGSTWLDDPDRARQLAWRMGELAGRIRQLEPVALDLRTAGQPETDGTRDAASASFVHGDFAPVNVVVDADGEIAALLDFEHAGPGPALLDVAWWGWVVRHHHPDAWGVAWPTFLQASGLTRGPIEYELHALALHALEGRAAAARDDETGRRWLARRSAAERWTVPG